MSFIILSSVSLSKCYLYVRRPPVLCLGQAMVGSGQSSAPWQHVPGLTMRGAFLAEWDGAADPRAVFGGSVLAAVGQVNSP